VDKHILQLNTLERNINSESSVFSIQKGWEELSIIHNNLVSLRKSYQDASITFRDYLTHQKSMENNSERDLLDVRVKTVDTKVIHILDQIKQTLKSKKVPIPNEDNKSESHKSTRSYRFPRTYSVCDSYVPAQELLELRMKAESTRVQIEYEKIQQELKKMKAEIDENEQNMKAKMQRRQSNLQANMDILDVQKNLSIAEAELKIFENKLENLTLDRITQNRTIVLEQSSISQTYRKLNKILNNNHL
jgi:hypothetical protein